MKEKTKKKRNKRKKERKERKKKKKTKKKEKGKKKERKKEREKVEECSLGEVVGADARGSSGDLHRLGDTRKDIRAMRREEKQK